MLLELRVDNLLIVDAAQLEPGAGLTVISGETGAGKSLLLDALHLLLGCRAQAEWVGPRSDSLCVTASIAINRQRAATLSEELGINCDEDCLILRRRIQGSGRSQCWINDQAVSVGTLRQVAQGLIELRSQNDPLRLAQPAYQCRLLDRYAGMSELADRYARVHRELTDLRVRLDTLRSQQDELLRERDFIRYQLDEIAQVDPQAGELAACEERQELLAGAQGWHATCEEAIFCLSEGEEPLIPLVASLARRLLDAPDPRLRQAAAACQQAEEALKEALGSCTQAADSIHPDPQALAAVEERLGLLLDLFRKHGGSESAFFASHQALLQREEELSQQGLESEALTEAIAALEKEEQQEGMALAEARRAAAGNFIAGVEAELARLGMPKARLSLVDHADRPATGHAYVQQEFLISTNPGLSPGSLGRVPSGGETSRIALAFAVVTADQADDEQIPVLVFDEIDAGVGGRLGAIIAQSLRRIANGRSVLAVSHTPQMAAQADVHYCVRKCHDELQTQVSVQRLQGPERLEEIADMLGGGNAALNQARTLLKDRNT